MNQSSAKTFKRQAESDSVSGKTNDTHNHWTKNLTGEKFTTIAHRGASGYAQNILLKHMIKVIMN